MKSLQLSSRPPIAHGSSRRDFLKSSGAFAFLMSLGGPLARTASAAFSTQQDALNYHFLNRTSWGVRPADLDRVGRIGISAYLEKQLAPESLPGFKKFVFPSSVWRIPRKRLLKNDDGANLAFKALLKGFVKRTTSSPAQLFERIVEFWSDHFNIASEELDVDVLDFQRSVIRPLALGKFRDLLIATARHPAMLQYLDNYLNIAEHPNENYAREVMELHTLSVDGGYTEMDVKEVARALTGWTTDYDFWGEGFHFDENTHDFEAKTVLGTAIPAGGGIEDGMTVLQMLADSAKTARFVCRKLIVRFVSDAPPATLINKMAATWAASDGDIKAVLRTMFLSDEFKTSIGAKFRRPLDYFIGALRMTGTVFTDFWYQEYLFEKLGQVPYGWHPPNGFPEPAAAWANANGLLERWNTAQIVTDDALTAGPDDGLRTSLDELIGPVKTAGELVDRCALQLLAQPLDAALRAQFVSFVADGGDESTRVNRALREEKLGPFCGLLFASPLFQWR